MTHLKVALGDRNKNDGEMMPRSKFVSAILFNAIELIAYTIINELIVAIKGSLPLHLCNIFFKIKFFIP